MFFALELVLGSLTRSCCSLLLLSTVDNLPELRLELIVLTLLPLLVRTLDAFLHLLQRLLQHLREVLVHRVDVKC